MIASPTRCLRLLLLAAFLTPLAAPASARGGEGLAALEQRVVESDLPNGMKILLLPRPKSPTVSLYMRFRVGSVDEEAGRSGLAHLLEHMMFKGTRRLGTRDYRREKVVREQIEETAAALDGERLRGADADQERSGALKERLRALQEEARRYVVKDEIDAIYTASGARGLNAGTGADLTTYKVNLPSNRIPLWAAIEAERLSDPVMREFYSERDVVVEERRQSFETDPSRRLTALLLSTAFEAHPYGRPVIGWAGDVDYLRSGEAEEFFRTWYSPGNAVLAVVGDFDPEGVLELLRRSFSSLHGRALPRRRVSVEPEQEGERRAVLSMDAEPRLMLAFHKPTLPSRDDYVFDLIEGILSRGRTSRLHRRLVEETQLAVSAYSSNGVPGSLYPNLFVVSAVPRHPHGPGEVEAVVLEELERLVREPVGEEELRRVRNQMRADVLRGLQSNEGLAGLLSYFEAVAGDWRYAVTHLDVLEQITPGEIRSTAARYLTAENRTVVHLLTSSGGEAQ